MYSVTMKVFYFLPLVFVILNGNVFDVTAHDHGIVDDLLNVILKLKKGTAYTHPRKILAFSATLSKGFTPAMNEIIKFDSIKTNIGGYYSPKTGVFTVPRPGLYMLSATVMSASGKHLHCVLLVNDVMSARLFGTNYSTGSLNTVLQLKKGDRVFIKKDPKKSKPSQYIYGQHYSMFSGYLIA